MLTVAFLQSYTNSLKQTLWAQFIHKDPEKSLNYLLIVCVLFFVYFMIPKIS